MKTGIFTVILFLLLSSNLKAQITISGVVTDSLNNPVPFASVYLSKTTEGTYTDNNGVYSLNIPLEGFYELIVSSIGYKLNSRVINAEGKTQEINVKLSRQIFLLNEVTIEANERNRHRNYSQFVKYFIGETINSLSCKIINPEDLHLYRDTENNILKGYSLKPLEIENKALGYTILYDLVDFSFNSKNMVTSYSGYHYFQPLTGPEKRNKIWEHNRLVAYYGSKLHFLRALYSDSLRQESFKIFESGFDTVKKEFSVIKPVLAKSFRSFNNSDYVNFFYKDTLLIRYTVNHPELFPQNSMPQPKTVARNYGELPVSIPADNPKATLKPEDSKPVVYNSFVYFSDTLRVYQNGYYSEPYSITWNGEMSNRRIADMLPEDYLPYKKVNDKVAPVIRNGDFHLTDSVYSGH